MSERRIAEKKITSAFETIRAEAEKALQAKDTACFGKGLLKAVFELENNLEIGHPKKWAEPAMFEMQRELYLPGRFIEFAIENKLEIGEVAKKYQNGDVRLVATPTQLGQLRKVANEICEPAHPEVARGVKTAARAVVKQLEKAFA
jgi:hypothetical protein